MKSLSPADQLFLWLEKKQQPMHVGGLHVFKYPEGAGPKYVTEIGQQLRAYTHPEAPFNQRLRFRLGNYYWQEDKRFDLEHHFRHESLPKPGRIRELLALISTQHSNTLDRERPLWESHLIEGISGRKFAFYHKVHHSVVDGIAAMRMTLRSYSAAAETRDMPPIWAMKPIAGGTSPPVPGDLIYNLRQLLGEAGKQISTVPALTREIAANILQARKNPDNISLFNAPHCILNSKITGSRRFSAQSYPIVKIKALAKKHHATINDIVVALCASALRNYLDNIRELPDRPLIAMVPMSVRRDDSDSGNQVAMILANLGTHIRDPIKRLETIKQSIEASKHRIKQMSQEEAINYSALTLAPSGLNMMTGLVPQLQAFNVIISNVPGPEKPMYWNGAQLEELYPVSIPVDRVALNITLVSYADHLEFGLTACRRSVPSMQRLLDYISAGIKELETGNSSR